MRFPTFFAPLHWTVRKKIIAGLTIIVCMGTVSMLAIYLGLSLIKQAMEDLANIKEPSSAAAYEMEINMNGMGLAILKYLDTGNPLYREWANGDAEDFEQFHARYLRLSRTPKTQELGTVIGSLYHEFTVLGQSLMKKRDEQAAVLATVTNNIEKINTIIDNKLQPTVGRQSPDALQKIEAIIDMEADIAEMGLWLANYQRQPEAEYKQLVFQHDKEFRDSLARFQNLALTTAERRWGEELASLFKQITMVFEEVLAREDLLRNQIKQFIDLRLQMDHLLDEEIQVLALQDLYTPRREADQATGYVLQTIQLLLPLFIFSAVGVAVLLIRVITRPIQALMNGTAAVGHGNLQYRIVPEGRDEFAELAQQFNRMVAELQATTVSKTLLEASEAKLQETVADLRREITERERAEEEQARLQVSLRRSETMSAMGALIAGVAHEVRNPLFAISSTLDAFEARFGTREEHQRYLSVLRGETDRLATLMQALLEYGKPSSAEFSLGEIKEAITPAVCVCAALAQAWHVEITGNGCRSRALIRMDRQRMQQVFQNLIANAIQHSPPGGSVGVEVTETNQDGQPWVECTVTDSGPGFQTKDLPKIFEPFFTRRRGGTGLGLSIVQRIVEEHAGTIAAGNRPEGGAIMTIRLPSIQQRTEHKEGVKESLGGAEQDLNC